MKTVHVILGFDPEDFTGTKVIKVFENRAAADRESSRLNASVQRLEEYGYESYAFAVNTYKVEDSTTVSLRERIIGSWRKFLQFLLTQTEKAWQG